MKKSILFVFALIPMLASCNNSGNGFVNPFPDDPYTPTGFKFAEEEIVENPLSSKEAALVDDTYANLSEYNKLIVKVEGQVRERNYERAFAGVFEQGYSISNQMFDNDFSTIHVADETTTEELEYERRQETKNKTKTVVDYSYGRSTVERTTKSFHYLGVKEDENGVNYAEYDKKVGTGDSEVVLEQTLETYATGEPTLISASILEAKSQSTEIEPWYSMEHFIIPMTGFIFPTASATAVPGVNKSGEAILVKEEHAPYGDDKSGIYSLPDGRRYEAMVNSITVTRLKVVQTKDENQKDWYIVDHVRQYSETAITSDVIQPNVPISYLANPIVIKFKEEKYHFSADEKVTSTDVINPVEIN